MGSFEDSLAKLRSIKNRPHGVTSKDWNNILKSVDELQKYKNVPFDLKKHKAQTQSDLAKMFIRYYFWFLAGLLVFTIAYNITMDHFDVSDFISVKDTFIMVSSTITPILAFVLGHYFKGKD